MDVIIVGGGIVGTATAARLGDAAHDVTLLERSSIGNETTAASAGMLLQAAVEPTAFDLELRARARSAYRELFERSSLESDRIGTLYVAETPAYADRLEASAATLRDRGVDATFVPAADLPAVGIDPEGFVGGLHTRDDRVCDPAAVATWFAERARAAGADVRTGVTVTDICTRDDSSSGVGSVSDGSAGSGADSASDGSAVSGVETDAGPLEADCVINAAGPWAPELNELAGVSLPLAHTVGPMVELEPETPLEEGAAPFTILESKRYVRPAFGDDSGIYVGEFLTEYHEGRLEDPATLSVPADFRESAPEVAAVAPALEGARVVDEWVGLRTVTPDGRPLVGETTVSGYLVACGMTGLGITLAPAVADVVRGVLEGTVDDEVRDRLAPTRF